MANNSFNKNLNDSLSSIVSIQKRIINTLSSITDTGFIFRKPESQNTLYLQIQTSVSPDFSNSDIVFDTYENSDSRKNLFVYTDGSYTSYSQGGIPSSVGQTRALVQNSGIKLHTYYRYRWEWLNGKTLNTGDWTASYYPSIADGIGTGNSSQGGSSSIDEITETINSLQGSITSLQSAFEDIAARILYIEQNALFPADTQKIYTYEQQQKILNTNYVSVDNIENDGKLTLQVSEIQYQQDENKENGGILILK